MLKSGQTTANAAYRMYAKAHGKDAMSFKAWLLEQKKSDNVNLDGTIKYFNVDGSGKNVGENVDLHATNVQTDATSVTDNNTEPKSEFKWLGMNPWIGIPLTAAVLYGAWKVYKHYKK